MAAGHPDTPASRGVAAVCVTRLLGCAEPPRSMLLVVPLALEERLAATILNRLEAHRVSEAEGGRPADRSTVGLVSRLAGGERFAVDELLGSALRWEVHTPARPTARFVSRCCFARGGLLDSILSWSCLHDLAAKASKESDESLTETCACDCSRPFASRSPSRRACWRAQSTGSLGLSPYEAAADAGALPLKGRRGDPSSSGGPVLESLEERCDPPLARARLRRTSSRPPNPIT